MMIGSLFGSENDEGVVFWDWENFWKMTALISIILAVMNLLPIPALDGGHVVILLIEMVRGRDIDPKILGYVQMVGLIMLLGLFVLANVNDVIRFFF
jgi:regulator of sigma E protease